MIGKGGEEKREEVNGCALKLCRTRNQQSNC